MGGSRKPNRFVMLKKLSSEYQIYAFAYFFACLYLDQKSSFLDGHYLTGVVIFSYASILEKIDILGQGPMQNWRTNLKV